MSSDIHDRVTKPVVIGVVAVLAILGTAWLQSTTGEDAPQAITSAPVGDSRVLVFRDAPNGAIEIVDLDAARTVALVRSGEGSFMRGVLRSLGRERMQHGLGPDEPYRLISYADGRLALEDLATGRFIDLNAFGPTQTEAFASLLSAREGKS